MVWSAGRSPVNIREQEFDWLYTRVVCLDGRWDEYRRIFEFKSMLIMCWSFVDGADRVEALFRKRPSGPPKEFQYHQTDQKDHLTEGVRKQHIDEPLVGAWGPTILTLRDDCGPKDHGRTLKDHFAESVCVIVRVASPAAWNVIGLPYIENMWRDKKWPGKTLRQTLL